MVASRTSLGKVLITGGAGFIGAHLVRALQQAQVADVVILDNLLPQVHGSRHDTADWLGSTSHINGDVRDAAVWRAVAEEHADIEVIVHLASLTGTGQSMRDISEYDSVNSGGTAALLEALLSPAKSGSGFPVLKHLVLASSRAIYGEGAYRAEGIPDRPLLYPPPRSAERLAKSDWSMRSPDGSELTPVPTPEDAPAQPSSFYGITKLVQEQYVGTMLEIVGIPHTILRLQNVYGPGQSLSNPYTGVMGVFFSNLVGGRPIDIYEDGKITRDFVYIKDVVDAIVTSIVRRVPGTYNIGSGQFTRMIDLAVALSDALGTDVDLRMQGRYRVGDVRHNAADLTLAHSALEYQPKVSLEDGLRSYIVWALDQTPMDEADVEAASLSLREK